MSNQEIVPVELDDAARGLGQPEPVLLTPTKLPPRRPGVNWDFVGWGVFLTLAGLVLVTSVWAVFFGPPIYQVSVNE
jgi:hypothetical protein